MRSSARVPVWRGITGALVAGWVAVLVVLLGAQFLSWTGGGEGPGAEVVAGHFAGAVLAAVAQYWADRSRGGPAGLAGAAVVALTVVLLWLFWWS